MLSDKKTRFGCVMFDLNDVGGKQEPMPGSGWASVDGGSSFRIKNVDDLSEDIVWLTNLNQVTLWKTGFVKQNKLKHSGYLRTELGQIMKEVGLVTPLVSIAEICEKLSDIFSRVMRLAVEFYGVKGFLQKDFSVELRSVIWGDDSNISIHMDEALSRAYQDLVICEKEDFSNDKSFITLKRPRYFHAKSILDTTIPLWDGDWEFFGPDQLLGNTKKRIDFLMSLEKPFVVKVSINSFQYPGKINVDLGKLLDLGEALGEGGRLKDRNWVCQPELLYLHKFADLNIEAAFVATGYDTVNDKIKIPFLGELSYFSYSLGLLAECVWVGLASRSVNPQTRAKTLVSPRACWLKAADRFMTLTSAMMLSSAGFKVVSYGYGGVTVSVDKRNVPDLVDLAPHAGLSVPVNLIAKS